MPLPKLNRGALVTIRRWGPYVQTRYASGRALGRYQMMSYLPEVQAEVSQVSGGTGMAQQD
jgi:hypothetical protein